MEILILMLLAMGVVSGLLIWLGVQLYRWLWVVVTTGTHKFYSKKPEIPQAKAWWRRR
jgi:hypothetical protein